MTNLRKTSCHTAQMLSDARNAGTRPRLAKKVAAFNFLFFFSQLANLLRQVGAVIVGFDRRINYHKIQTATLCIRENPGCHFIATNLDAVTHLTDAQEWAGNGAMVGAIKGEHCCQQCGSSACFLGETRQSRYCRRGRALSCNLTSPQPASTHPQPPRDTAWADASRHCKARVALQRA